MRVFKENMMAMQDSEWDVDLVDDSEVRQKFISDNKWVKLALIPVHFILLFLLAIVGTIVCATVISPIFVFTKCAAAFLDSVRDVIKSFKCD